MYVTIDLDDTLIHGQRDYDAAILRLGRWISSQTDVDENEVKDHLNEIDRENLSEYGLAKERFLTSFEETANELLDSPSSEDIKHARKLGNTAFLTAEEYGERGFKPDAKEMLYRLKELGATLHLITSGDAEVQKRKISGLDLDQYFDEISIVGMDGKTEILEDIADRHGFESVFHVGNSLSSDVESAIVAGITAIYIPDSEWQRTSDGVPEAASRDDVYLYDNISEFIANFDEVFTDIGSSVQGNSETEAWN